MTIPRTARRFGFVLTAGIALAAAFSNAADASEHRVRGYRLETLTSVRDVLDKGRDDQYAELVGRFTSRINEEMFRFEDSTGAIDAELDDDRDWTFSKDQIVRVRAEVERDDGRVTIEVWEVLPER